MPDAVSSLSMFELIFRTMGPVGLIMIFWYLDSRRVDKILKRYKEDMQEVRQMYRDNVELVKQYEGLARDLKDIVIMNTQSWQGARDDISGNKFCPMVRLEKKAAGAQG